MGKSKKILLSFLLVFLVLVVAVFCFFFVGSVPVQKHITWGVDFSQMQAQSLGLNWKNTYLAIITDLGAKNIKLHTQWDYIEGTQNTYYFGDTDWQLQEAQQNNVSIIYVLGMKTGRWPECHIPTWAETMSEKDQQAALLQYMTAVVNRYKSSPAIQYWQVENEPLFQFGQCPSWYYQNTDFLKTEVALVKSLDPSRQIIVSDSGEQSDWFGAANIGDIVGITMYREVWAHITNNFGFYIHYFFRPITYYRKAWLIQKIFGKKVICIELQAEPWTSQPFPTLPVAQQYQSMSPATFDDNVTYAKQTGFDTFYFWGVEWWYWLKTVQNQPQIWNEAKAIFQQ